MSDFDNFLGYVLLAGLPLLSTLTAMQPPGRFYIASVIAAICLFFDSFFDAMQDADGPSGFGVMVYFGFVAWFFIAVHSIKLLIICSKRMFTYWMTKKLSIKAQF